MVVPIAVYDGYKAHAFVERSRSGDAIRLVKARQHSCLRCRCEVSLLGVGLRHGIEQCLSIRPDAPRFGVQCIETARSCSAWGEMPRASDAHYQKCCSQSQEGRRDDVFSHMYFACS